MVRSRISSPVAALMMRTWRSWISIRMWVRAWVRPTPMWWRRPPTRRVMLPVSSTWSRRTVGVETFAGGGFGAGCVGGGGGGLMGHSAVGSVVVVFVEEGVELGL